SVTSAWTSKRNTGSSAGGTVASGTASNWMVQDPSARVVAVPWAISWAPTPIGAGRNHPSHGGNRTWRTTRQLTAAPSMGAPVYAVARPVSDTGPRSRGGSAGADTSTWNRGRLYSSTWIVVPPTGPSSTAICIVPVRPWLGAVNAPENEPKSLER